MDTSRMSAAQIQMYYNKQRHQQEKDQKENSQDEVRQRQQTNNGSPNQLRDLLKSDFFATTKQTLSNNRKKEHIQKNLNDTIDNLSNDKLDDFANKF